MADLDGVSPVAEDDGQGGGGTPAPAPAVGPLYFQSAAAGLTAVYTSTHSLAATAIAGVVAVVVGWRLQAGGVHAALEAADES